jgi:hypothetical protein
MTTSNAEQLDNCSHTTSAQLPSYCVQLLTLRHPQHAKLCHCSRLAHQVFAVASRIAAALAHERQNVRLACLSGLVIQTGRAAS